MRRLVSLIITKVQFPSFFSTNGTLPRSCATNYLSLRGVIAFWINQPPPCCGKMAFLSRILMTFRFEEDLDGILDIDKQIKT